jgi:hypothetical protein
MSLTKVSYSMIQGAVVNVLDFGADNTGATSASTAIQNAINSISSGVVFIPKGTYLISASITTKDGVIIQGEGGASQLLVNTDIEVFKSATTTTSTGIFGAGFTDFFINKTVSTATTKYDIHLQNPSFCNFTRVHIKSGHDDTQYSNTNVGGIWLDRPPASTNAAYCNRLDDCWIQNNSIYFLNITDSVINGGYVWGHTRQFAIRLAAAGGNSCGAIGIENVVGIICSKYEGGIWLDGASINQIRISGNEFDGNPLLDTGYGVLCLQQALAVTITGNTFWGCDYHAIWAKDATNWTITGNVFWKNGARDDILYGYDDIRLESVNIPVGSVTVTGNTHLIDDTRTNPGFAVRFVVTGGYYPDRCSVIGNTVKGSYQSSGFYILGNVQFAGNQPLIIEAQRLVNGYELSGNFVSNAIYTAGIRATSNDQVAGNGTLDIQLTDGGSDLGFVGHLYVTSTRLGSATVSTRTIYTVVGHGTTSTITSVVTQNGSGGGSTFTITNPTAGLIRFTDTSGVYVIAGITFVGSRGL